MTEIAKRIAQVRERIEAACRRSGRAAGSVRLLAVSKTKPLSDMQEAYDAGCREFGENYVQEILEKDGQLPPDAKLHMIGHLQTNKVGKIVGRVAEIHSVDSVRLAKEIEKQASKREIPEVKVLLEVNVAKEETKFGFQCEEVAEALSEIHAACPHVNVQGLMTSAPITEEPETNRVYFRKLRELAEKNGLSELSMGMTDDFEVAVEEGATIVRVGTAIFGPRSYARQ